MINIINKQKMKYLRWLIIGIFISLFVIIGNSDFFANAASKEPKHYTELELSPPPEIKIPDYTTDQLENGLTLYLIEDHEFPLITGTARFRTGSRLEPTDKVGLASLTGSLMRRGGTENYSPDELNQMLEQRAASIETSINTTSGSAEFDCLTGDLEQVFNLFAEVIKSPAFDEQQFALAKQQAEGRISRRDDDPGEVADRKFQKLIYGEQSPYARTEEYETLENISREDVIAFYENYLRPEEMILGIVGDFDPEEMRDRVEEAFGNWEVSTPTPAYDIPEAKQATTDGIHLVEKPELSQSYVEMGHLGGTLDNPDYPALRVLNGALNGFGGTLYNELRSRQGLAYSVYGVWRANYDYPGYFVAGGQTSSETTVPFIQSIREEIAKVRDDLLSEDQLAYAKESILNSFIFNFEDNKQTLSRLMRYAYYDYPDDFIFKLQERIKETTKEDVQRVAQTYLQPEDITTLIVGNPDGINPSLEELGETVTSNPFD